MKGLMNGLWPGAYANAVRQSDMRAIPADAQHINGDNSEILGSSRKNPSGRPWQGNDNIKTKGNSAWQCFPTST
jgi:hypothetical protein